MAKNQTTEIIVNGEAFRAINLLIDQKAGQIEHWMKTLQSRINDSRGGYVRVRTADEEKNISKRDFPLPMHPVEAKDLAEAAAMIVSLDREINDLQRFKLRLLNDYDFTHGDDGEQRLVFGAAIPPGNDKATGDIIS
jgi:hypothetical protein